MQPDEIWLGVRFIIECDYFTGKVLDIDGGLQL
jgi:3-oxoacyl-[acyl-carrier protein] reductase